MTVVVPASKNNTTLLETFKSNLQSRTNINIGDRDSKAGALYDIFSNQFVMSRKEVIESFRNSTINAEGDALDLVGNNIGIKRLMATKANSLASDKVFAFYTDETNFGVLNGGVSFTVPKGTVVYSDQNQNDSGRSIRYVLTNNVILNATDNIEFASIEAEGVGSTYNVGANVLIANNFTTYTAGKGLKCINFYSILNGRDKQTDRTYRSAIVNFFAGLPIVNDLRIKFSTLQIPGVIDTKIIDAYYGIGTSAIVVLGSEYQTNTSILTRVQNVLNTMQMPGISLYAISASKASFSIELTVQKTSEFTELQKTHIHNNILKYSRDYLRNLGLGGEVSLEDFYTYLVNKVSTVAFVKDDLFFNSVLVSRSNGLVSHPAYEELNSTLYALDNEEYADISSISINYV